MVKTSGSLGSSILLGVLVLLVLAVLSEGFRVYVIAKAAQITQLISQIQRSTSAAPFQELEPRKGHVPVYIRHGDEPLGEIHPGLAEAFKEAESKSLVTEAPQAETTNPPTPSEAPAPSSSTVSDIASFEAIKGNAD